MNGRTTNIHRNTFDLLGNVVHIALEIMVLMRASKRQCGDEQSEETVAMHHFRNAVRHESCCQPAPFLYSTHTPTSYNARATWLS